MFSYLREILKKIKWWKYTRVFDLLEMAIVNWLIQLMSMWTHFHSSREIVSVDEMK